VLWCPSSESLRALTTASELQPRLSGRRSAIRRSHTAMATARRTGRWR
jgi:hypothetical protein